MVSTLRLVTLLLVSSFQFAVSDELVSIKDVDFRVYQFERHHTKEFYGSNTGVSHVILRRGELFKFTVQLNEEYKRQKIEATFKFATPRDRQIVTLKSGVNSNGWSMEQSGAGNNIDVTVTIPANVPVGVWELEIALDKGSGVVERWESPNKIIILFNPWSEADDAYFPEKEKLSEYIMNEKGYTYTYNHVRPSGRPWVFGQFQPEVLDAVLFALNNANLRASERADIVRVSRELTYLLNDHGWRLSRGVLRGKWEEPYDTFDNRPAKKPWEWTGSPDIFLEYYKSGGKPVGYGQCWVFGAILTTACRALGIPARPVTNLLSAHSKKRDLTIDIHLDENLNVTKRELVWNFHVWTEAWFKRSDLEGDIGESGWQAIDATPQEYNDGKFQVGPASLKAIRNSDLKTRYESAFLYEEVNADEVYYGPNEEILLIDRVSVGKAVITKRFNREYYEDLKMSYKPYEGTEEERESYRQAAKSLGITPPSLKHIESRSSKKDVIIAIESKTGIEMGLPVSVAVVLRNPAYATKKIDVEIKATALYYTGKDANVLKQSSKRVTLTSSRAEKIPFIITPNEYSDKLRDTYTIRLEVIAKNGKLLGYQKKLVSLETPELKITAPKSVYTNKTMSVKMVVQNPYNHKLKGGRVAYEGTRIKQVMVPIPDIPAKKSTTVTINIKPTVAHKETVVFKYFAGNLQMTTSTDFIVKGKPVYNFASYGLDRRALQNELEAAMVAPGPRGPHKRVVSIKAKHFKCCKVKTF